MVYAKYDCSSCYCDLSRGAAACLIKAKRSGVKMYRMSAGGNCSNKNKKKKKKLTGPVIAKKTMFITGMHCEHCVQSVTDSLNRIDGVSARVDINKSCAEISLDREIGKDTLICAVEKAGFLVGVCSKLDRGISYGRKRGMNR